MGEVRTPASAALIVAAFSRYDEALDWSRQRMVQAWGRIALASPAFEFDQTDYYLPTMGPGLRKVFWAFEQRIDPGRLVECKLMSNRWESEYAGLGRHAEPRPLNLDPGYLGLGKLVLASTKDFTHRIYLAGGIYAEVTLNYRHQRWEGHPWTFPDYRRADYHQFFTRVRDWLHRQQQGVSR